MVPARGDRKKDAVYDFILDQLISRSYRFGGKIMVKEIAEATGASRQPIMAAMGDLRFAGFVVVTAQVGCEVVRPTRTEVEDFYLLFGRFEGLIAELAAQRQVPGEAARLIEVNAAFAALPPSARSSSLTYLEINREFHLCLHEISRSPALHRQQVANWAFSDFLIAQTYEVPPRLGIYAQEHQAIIDAILQLNPAAAREAAENHIRSVSRLVTDAMAKAPQ